MPGFTKDQIPGAIVIIAAGIWAGMSGHLAGYLIGLGAFYAGAIGTTYAMALYYRLKVRHILKRNPWLGYLYAIHKEFGRDGRI